MTDELGAFWVFLSDSPLLGLTITLLAFLAATWFWERTGRHALAHPVLPAILLLMGFLWVTGIEYQTYFDGAQYIHFLLGPATVALAIPLYDHLARIRELLVPLLVAGTVGATTAALSAVGVALALGASRETLLSLAPKSVTSPIAMGIAEKIGGLPSLTAGLVLITGTMGCITAPLVFRVLRLRDESVQGFALGVAAHGFGTAQAFGISALAGAFAGLGLGLAGILTALILPLLPLLLPG